MSDLWMVWARLGRAVQELDRTRLRELCVEHGITDGVGSGTKVGAYNRAIQVRHLYTGPDGVAYTLSASVAKASDREIVAQVLRHDGYKVAEYTFFRGGKVRAMPGVKARLRTNMTSVDRRATKEWVAKADAVYESADQVLPPNALAQTIAMTLGGPGWPVPMLTQAYFLYEDDLDLALGLRRFLGEASVDGDVLMVGLDDEDYSLPATAADLHLLPRAKEITRRAQTCIEHSDPALLAAGRHLEALRQVHGRHERRLGRALPLTGAQMDLADRTITEVVRVSTLPFAHTR